jgi:hypothetical protein
MNGKVSSKTMWRFTLIPQREGEWVIPSISVETSDGSLSSKPISIRVVKGTTADSANPTEESRVSVTSDVSNAKPYKNEPIIYTVRLISTNEMTNIKAQKFNIDDAMIETNGEPKIFSKIVNGMNTHMIEFSFLITPLKAGLMKIPPLIIHGVSPVKRTTNSRSFFDDDFDSFSMMLGFDRLKPFALATEEAILEVQPAVAEMVPWIPAKSLIIEDLLDETQLLQVGEPFTRIFSISAEGLKSS